MNKEKCLAFDIYPKPKGTRYFEEDLKNERTVLILFESCQIWDAMIYKEGWRFLIDYHGYEKLFEINKKSDYLDVSTLEEFIDEVEQEIETALSNV